MLHAIVFFIMQFGRNIMHTLQADPIAIVGIGCRFPGDASNPDKFWRLLCEGRDAIVDVPKDRWDTRRFYDPNVNIPAKMYVKQGGFLTEKWADFDAEFFHISPREAEFLDPQQRLLLEIVWEAMEDGGIIPEHIRRSNTGVFIGAFTTDWQTLQNSPYNARNCGVYSGINSSKTILSARLSHFFDLKGPCLSVDTACSSSLVALHLACRSLWNHESTLAIAGGVNAMLVPETTVAMSKGRFLNPEGRCRSFDADARGYVRGEGGGVVILKRFSEAIRDRDPIYALIRGTGVNQDGCTQGIVQPDAEAQKSLIEKVLCESGVKPWQIHYVEAHGTGTPVGDPIEAKALNDVLASEHRSHPCNIGALKSNLGHLEAAAGIAGLIKTALCLKHKKIPPNLHYKTASPNIPFEKYCLKVPVCLEEFPPFENSHFAGVNAFGYGGTNAHAVLQSYEATVESSPKGSTQPFLFPLSAKTSEGLKGVTKDLAVFLSENPDASLCDVSHTLSHKRTSFEHRLAITAQSTAELVHKLEQYAKGERTDGLVQGKAIIQPSLAFVYTGMGPQCLNMGKQLFESSFVFRGVIQKCDQYVLALTGRSLLKELFDSGESSSIEDPQLAQLTNFAVQAALTELFKSWGIQPHAVVGHSIGEVAAAYASGVLSLEDGLLVSYHRSRLQSTRKGQGTMLAVGMGKDEVQPLLKQYNVSIAAENSLHSLTLAGSAEDLTLIAEFLDQKTIFNRFLKVNIAYHSHQMEGLENDVLTALQGLTPHAPKLPLFSTVYADECGDRLLDAQYWWKNIRQPVLFAQTLQNMIAKGYQLFVEIGPHPVLASYIKEGIEYSQVKGDAFASLNKKKPDTVSLLECVGGLYTKGFPVNWQKFLPVDGKFIRLPTYPWQKKSFWVESEESRQYRVSAAPTYVFLSRRINAPQPTWRIEANSQYFPWIEDHKIDGTIVFPAAGYVEACLEVQWALHGNVSCLLEDVDFQQLLTLQLDKETFLQFTWIEEKKTLQVHSSADVDEWDWTCHAVGKCSTYSKVPDTKIELDSFRQEAYVEADGIYQQFAELGLEYGPAFQGIKKLWKKNEEALAEIYIPNHAEQYRLYPPQLDAALQALIGTIDSGTFNGALVLPCHIERLIFHKTLPDLFFCHVKCTKQSKNKITGNLLLCDADGEVCVEVKGLQCRLLTGHLQQKMGRLLYHLVWEEKPLPQARVESNETWLFGVSTDKLKEIPSSSCSTYSYEDLQTQEKAEKVIALNRNVDHIVFSYELESSATPLEAAEIQAIQACMHLVKAVDKEQGDQAATLWIITRNAQFVEKDQTPHLKGAALWGLVRVIRQEYPHLVCRLVDLGKNDELDLVIKEASHQSQDVEVVWRGQHRYIPKLKRGEASKEDQELLPFSAPKEAFTLDLKKPGVIESLFYKEIVKRAPAQGEVEIEVHASSLNFKDLMKVLGMLDENVLEDTYFGESFGMECSGTIVSIGPNVKKYKVGDRVCAFVPNTFQSHITLSAQVIFPIPPNVSLEEAPIYVPFVTVLRALNEIAKLKKDETILIHSAAGAVGLAGIQYAQHVGAKIIATAGSEEKRSYLANLGVYQCSDSRSLSFVEDVMHWTEGRGVDVVFNSLAGEALEKSWSLLAPYGRFIEIGKRDISANSGLAMRYFNGNTQFAAIDLDRTFRDQPERMQRLLGKAYALFEKGVFKPLPCHLFSAHEVVQAFQFMARSKHMGKIMLILAQQTVQGIPLSLQKAIVSPHHSYLVTGGFSGFGLLAAKWLAEKGAKNLILVGRSGASTLEAQKTLEKLRSQGVFVKEASIDVTRSEQVSQLIQECDDEMPPLKGVIHSAMVLQDAFIHQLTEESIRKVLLPKMSGCMNVHKSTLHHSLDFFVLFSSVASIIGNPGQGNYAAANAFLDHFCHYRRSLGLQGTTINWGALQMGVLTRDSKVAKHLENHGIKGIPAKIALNVLERAIVGRVSQFCALDIDWQILMQSMPSLKTSSLFSDFCTENASGTASTAFVDELRNAEETKRMTLIIDMLKDSIGKTLKMEACSIDISVRLNTLGVDSLMAMELQVTMEEALGIKIPTMELMKGPTIEQLARLSLKLLRLF